MAITVTAPLVITKKPDGSDLYLYENSELPDFVSADEVKRLTTLGMVSKSDSASKKPIAESN